MFALPHLKAWKPGSPPKDSPSTAKWSQRDADDSIEQVCNDVVKKLERMEQIVDRDVP